MDVGQDGGRVDVRVRRVVAHPADVVLDRAGEELHVLRQVADVLAELPGVPVPEVHEVEPHAAGGGQDRAHEHLAERGLARARVADDGQRLAGVEREGHAVQHDLLRAAGGT